MLCSVLCFFLSFRDRLVTAFDTLFTGSGEPDLSPESNFAQKWGWYSTFYQLSKGDVTRFGKVSELSLYAALTMITYEKEKNELEKSLLKI